MQDLFYFTLQFLPYVVALFQGIMYVFVIVLLARATGPLVRALKAYAAEHAPQKPAQPAPVSCEQDDAGVQNVEEDAQPEQETTDPQF
ncbi:hypothetical protein H8711_04580 [Clostridiaceae bacterium NSJ-31]|uniref:Uncharacterized protein n=1 Tax=Ligaoa zhengdingensis TaxID=2763658 RepID=A0A926DWT2_9FIRM|nr:hypothetical protein [Ligaoa zhengdingensis]MBC8546211.1 hypothetical protein [Ligaoa zhengdingensis]